MSEPQPAAVSAVGGDAAGGSRKRKRAPAALAPEQLASFDAAEGRRGVVSNGNAASAAHAQRARARGAPWAPCTAECVQRAVAVSTSRPHPWPHPPPPPPQVYLSRIPPFMNPVKVRHLLEKHAEIGRIYLAPEGACHAAATTPTVRHRATASERCHHRAAPWSPGSARSSLGTHALLTHPGRSPRGPHAQTPRRTSAASSRAATRSPSSPRAGSSLSTSAMPNTWRRC